MSCRAFRHLLVLLDDDERSRWSVVERAIEIAEVERARLTIAKTTDPGRCVKWFAPMATVSRAGLVIAADTDTPRCALDQVSRCIPASIPFTRVLLGEDTARALRRLAETEVFDLLVVREGFAAHNRGVWREIRRLNVSVLKVCTAPPSEGSPASRGPSVVSAPVVPNPMRQEGFVERPN